MATSTDPPTGTTGAANRLGDWLLTHTGRSFYPIDPRPEEVELIDLGHSLALQCRWNGHVRFHYSIAQHAVAVAEVVATVHPELALAALHHDSPEAYIGDMARPWKRMLCVGQARWPASHSSVGRAEETIRHAIFDAFGIREPSAEGWATISEIDNRMLRTEYEQLMPKRVGSWADLGAPLPHLVINEWSPGAAERVFLDLHHRLMHEHHAHGSPS